MVKPIKEDYIDDNSPKDIVDAEWLNEVAYYINYLYDGTEISTGNVGKVNSTSVNDSGSTTSDLWTASKINTELSSKADSSHNHDSDYVSLTGDTMSGNLTIDKSTPTLKIKQTSNNIEFETKAYVSGASGILVEMNPKPPSNTVEAGIRIFRSTDTTGNKYISLLKGDNSTTVSTRLGVDSLDSYFQITGGNFGIGLTNPSEKLEVDGNIKATGMYIDSEAVATETYVDTAVTNLIDTAPGTLDTLNELAAALGDDPNFATTVTTALGNKADDSSVVHLTGTESITGAKTFTSTTNIENIENNETGNNHFKIKMDSTTGTWAGQIQTEDSLGALTNRLVVTGGSDTATIEVLNSNLDMNNNNITNLSTDFITGLTADSSPDGGVDYVMTYDDSAASFKKVLVGNLDQSAVRPASKVIGAVGSSYNDYTCDGTADEVQIQAAIDALYALGGGTVYLKEGTYYIDDSIVMKDNVHLIGSGWGTIISATDNYSNSTSSAGITSTLNEGGILSDSDTTITVTDASSFPSRGFVQIDSELIHYTGKSTNDLTGCTRGRAGTTATTHTDTTTVTVMNVSSWPMITTSVTSGSVTGNQNISVKELKLDGSNSSNVGGFSVSQTSPTYENPDNYHRNITLEKVWCYKTGHADRNNYAGSGINLKRIIYGNVIDCLADEVGNDGIHFEYSYFGLIRRSKTFKNKYNVGMHVHRGYGNRIEDCECELTFSDGFQYKGWDSGDYNNSLNGAITSTDTTITLSNASGFMEEGTIKIGSELISYYGKSGNVLQNCVRGQYGTTAASASSGATVTRIYLFRDNIFMNCTAKFCGLGNDPASAQDLGSGFFINENYNYFTKVINCEAYGSGHAGVKISHSCKYVTIKNCTFQQSGYGTSTTEGHGIGLNGGNFHKVEGCTILDSRGGGIRGTGISDTIIVNNRIQGAGKYGVRIGQRCLVENNLVTNCGKDSGAASEEKYGIVDDSTWPSHYSIFKDNIMSNNTNGDYYLSDSNNVTIVNDGVYMFPTEYDNGNSGTSDTIDWKNGQKQKSTLTGNVTYTFSNHNVESGSANYTLKLVQDGTGGRDITWPGTVKWPAGEPVWIDGTANQMNIVTFYWDGTNYIGSATGWFS